jgi:hypothetical protein
MINLILPGPKIFPKRTRFGGKICCAIRDFSSNFNVSIKLLSLIIEYI